MGQKLGKYSVEILGESVGESKSQIQRYIRLTELIPKILDMVDEGRIAMRPAVEISYLTKDEQYTLLDTMEYEDCTPSHVQAIKMRKLSEEKRLSEDAISSILSEQKVFRMKNWILSLLQPKMQKNTCRQAKIIFPV